jgi:hypothetical protein
MAAMENPLANPLSELVDDAGSRPDLVWKVAGAGAGIIGAIAARKVIDRVRLHASDRGDVPLNPGHERISWPYALGWAGIVGIGAAVGRVVAQRIVAAVWQRKRRLPVSAMPT